MTNGRCPLRVVCMFIPVSSREHKLAIYVQLGCIPNSYVQEQEKMAGEKMDSLSASIFSPIFCS